MREKALIYRVCQYAWSNTPTHGQFLATKMKSLYTELGKDAHIWHSQTHVSWFQHTTTYSTLSGKQEHMTLEVDSRMPGVGVRKRRGVPEIFLAQNTKIVETKEKEQTFKYKDSEWREKNLFYTNVLQLSSAI